jgi:predicted hotdog family 3-hydroxylacyl-ACP dehydratase
MSDIMPAPAALLLHDPPMVLLDSILEMGDKYCVARTNVREGIVFGRKDGSLPGWVGLELMAQTVAAWSGFHKVKMGGIPRPGYLLGTRRYNCQLSAFQPGTSLDVRIEQEFRDISGLAAFNCMIMIGEELVAESTVKVFEEPENTK